MTLTERLKLEVFIREQIELHGDSFYEELAKILARIDNEHAESVDGRGKPNFVVRW